MQVIRKELCSERMDFPVSIIDTKFKREDHDDESINIKQTF